MVCCDVCGSKSPIGKDQAPFPGVGWPISVTPPATLSVRARHLCWPCFDEILGQLITEAHLRKTSTVCPPSEKV